MSLGYGIYLVGYSATTRIVERITSSQLQKKKVGAFKVLLLYMQDWSFVAILTGTLWLAGGLGLKKILGDIFNERILLISLVSIFTLALFFSSFILRNKAKVKKDGDFKYYPQLIAISTAAPGVGLLIATIIPNIKGISTQFFLYTFLASLMGIIILPYFVWGLYEIRILGLREWPSSNKAGSEFVVSFQNTEKK